MKVVVLLQKLNTCIKAVLSRNSVTSRSVNISSANDVGLNTCVMEVTGLAQRTLTDRWLVDE